MPIQAQREGGGTAPTHSQPGNRKKFVVSTTLHPLYSRRKRVPAVQETGWASGPVLRVWEIPPPPEFDPRRILMKLYFSRQTPEKSSIPYSMKIRPVAVESFHADRRTDMTNLIVAFRNFANAPKNTAYVLLAYFIISIPRIPTLVFQNVPSPSDLFTIILLTLLIFPYASYKQDGQR
jgi:hypothetical protein